MNNLFIRREITSGVLRKVIDLRILLGVGLLAYFSSILYFGYFVGNYRSFWYYVLGVDAHYFLFFDLDGIAAGCESIREGFDPFLLNPNDTICRKLNYPRVWHLLSYTGFSRRDTFYAGIVLALIFFFTCFSYFEKIPPKEWPRFCLYFVALFSSNVMFLVERGNNDIIIFGLLVVAISFRNKPWLFHSLILLSSILKLYPIVACASGLKKDIRNNLPVIITVLAFLLYIAFTWADLALVSSATPRSTWLSYGMNVLWEVVSQNVPLSFIFFTQKILPFILVILLLITAFFYAFSSDRNLKGLANTKYGCGFLIGAMVYCSTFVIGNNFDYRLSFLILVIPQLYDWAKEEKGIGLCTLSIFSVLLLLWNNALFNYFRFIGFENILFFVEEIISWILFYALLLSMFKWMISEFSLKDYFGKAGSLQGEFKN